jgi:hypothetical protein
VLLSQEKNIYTIASIAWQSDEVALNKIGQMRKQKLARLKKIKKFISISRNHLQNHPKDFSANFQQKRASSNVIQRPQY